MVSFTSIPEIKEQEVPQEINDLLQKNLKNMKEGKMLTGGTSAIKAQAGAESPSIIEFSTKADCISMKLFLVKKTHFLVRKYQRLQISG